MKLLYIRVIRFLFVVATVSAEAVISDDVPDPEDVECQTGGGSAMSFEDKCDARNHTFTSQCKVEEREEEDDDGNTIIVCHVEEDECGCLYWQNDAETGYVSAIEENNDKCNACFVHGYTPEISDDVPQGATCKANGAAMTFDGSCRSRNHTFTSQCKLTEKERKCYVEEEECGCLYWQNDGADGVNGLEENPNKCDACNVHGYPEKESSAFAITTTGVLGFILFSVASLLNL